MNINRRIGFAWNGIKGLLLEVEIGGVASVPESMSQGHNKVKEHLGMTDFLLVQFMENLGDLNADQVLLVGQALVTLSTKSWTLGVWSRNGDCFILSKVRPGGAFEVGQDIPRKNLVIL